MYSKILAACLVGSVAADSEPLIQVALAPPVDAGSSFSSYGKAESAMEASGVSSLQKAMSSALASAKAEIDAVVHHSSFLQGAPVFIRVMSGPESGASAGRVAAFENVRSDLESKRIAQATAEFGALAKIVIGELKSALHGSFLQKGAGSIGVKVKASDIPWASTVDLLQATESSRDASEVALQGKILDMQIQFVKALNGMIASALG
ncbi:unnamed protein product [Amoebophrya sp. A120]|nr:unnamed protein product [Amoebophrya sp. A120]|eukprot:GSA120T00026086001.1